MYQARGNTWYAVQGASYTFLGKYNNDSVRGAVDDLISFELVYLASC